MGSSSLNAEVNAFNRLHHGSGLEFLVLRIELATGVFKENEFQSLVVALTCFPDVGRIQVEQRQGFRRGSWESSCGKQCRVNGREWTSAHRVKSISISKKLAERVGFETIVQRSFM